MLPSISSSNVTVHVFAPNHRNYPTQITIHIVWNVIKFCILNDNVWNTLYCDLRRCTLKLSLAFVVSNSFSLCQMCLKSLARFSQRNFQGCSDKNSSKNVEHYPKNIDRIWVLIMSSIDGLGCIALYCVLLQVVIDLLFTTKTDAFNFTRNRRKQNADFCLKL